MQSCLQVILLFLCNLLTFCQIVSDIPKQYLCFPKQFYDLETRQCESCPLECGNCYENNCLDCSIGQTQNSQCIQSILNCPFGQFYNKLSSTCTNCNIPFCSDCDSSSKCTSCEKGFTLSKDFKCIKKYKVTEDFLSNITCPSRYQINKNDCEQQQMCTSNAYRNKQYFEMNIIQTLTYGNNLIGLSNEEVIVYDLETFTYIKTLFNLPYQSTEYIFGATLYKNTLNILTQLNIYTFEMENNSFIAKYSINSDLVVGDQNQKRIFASEADDLLTYISLSNLSQNINCLQFQISYSHNTFQLTLIPKKSTLLLDNTNTNGIVYFSYFERLGIVGIIQNTKVIFVNLLNGSLLSQPTNPMNYDTFSITSTQEIQSNNQISFYISMQLRQSLSILKIIYSINASAGKDTMNLLSVLQPLPVFQKEYLSFLYTKAENMNGKMYLLILYTIVNLNLINGGTTLQINLQEFDYYFADKNLNQYYSFTYSGKVFQLSKEPDSVLLYQRISQDNNNKIVLFISYQSRITFIELDNSTSSANKFTQVLSFQIQTNALVLYKQKNLSTNSDQQSNLIIFYYGTLIGKINEPIIDQKITYMITRYENPISKDQTFFNNFQITRVVIPSPIKERKSSINRTSFIVLEQYYQRGFSVIQIEEKVNGDYDIQGYKFIFINYENQSGSSQYTGTFRVYEDSVYDNINQVLTVVTTIGMYSIRYNSLELINLLQYQEFQFRRDSQFIYNQIFLNQDQDIETYFNSIQLDNQGIPDNSTKTILLNYQNGYRINRRWIVFYYTNKYNSTNYLLSTRSEQEDYYVSLQVGNIFCILYDTYRSYQDIKFYSSSTFITLQQNNTVTTINRIDLTSCYQSPIIWVAESTKYVLPQELQCFLREYQRFSLCFLHQNDYIQFTSKVTLYLIDWESYGTQSVLRKDVAVLEEEDIIDTEYQYTFQQQILIAKEQDYSTYQLVFVKSTFDPLNDRYVSIIIKFNDLTGQAEIISRTSQILFASCYLSKINKQFFFFNSNNRLGQKIFLQKDLLSFSLFQNVYSYPSNENVFIWKHSLIYRDNEKAMIIRQIFQKSETKIKIDKYCFNADELGMVVAVESNNVLFISMDKMEIFHKIQVSYASTLYVSWSKKYSTLIIVRDLTVDFYVKEGLFNEVSFSIQLPKQELSECVALLYQPQIACEKIGIFDFQERKWYMNSEITIYQPFTIEHEIVQNEFYSIFHVTTNCNEFILFDQSLHIYSSKKKIEIQNISQTQLYLREGVKNQIVLVNENQECGIYSFPDLSKLFYLKNSQVNGFKCFYNALKGKLIVRSSKVLSIYNIPYKFSTNIIKLNPFEFNSECQFILTENYILIVSLIHATSDETYQINVQRYHINNGTADNYQYVLTDTIEGKLEYWEEKHVLFNDKMILQISDMQFGWIQDEFRFIDYSNRYNYLFIQINQGNELYLSQLDISESFLQNSQNSKLLPWLSIQNQNLYKNSLLDKANYFNSLAQTDSETVIYLDLTSQKLMKFSLVSLQTETLFQLKEYFEQSLLKTIYKIEELRDKINKDVVYTVLYLKCKIFILQNKVLIQLIDVLQYSDSCNYSITENQIIFINKTNISILSIQNQQLQSFIINLGNNNENIIEYLFDHTGQWMLYLIGNKTILNYIDQTTFQIQYSQEININPQKISLIKYLDFQNETLIVIGDQDSNLLISSIKVSSSSISIGKYNIFNHNQLIFIHIILIIITIDEMYNDNLNCGIIKQLSFTVIEGGSSVKELKLFIYVTCKTRISLINGVYNYSTNQYVTLFKLQIQQLLHTRLQHQLKLLKNRYVAVVSSVQISIYSLGLQYLNYIEEISFIRVSNILLAPDGYTLFILDSNAVYIYRISAINLVDKLIIQESFQYVIPQIYSIKYLYKDQPSLVAYGIDGNGFFQINYQPQIFSDQLISCYNQINSLSDNQQQNNQYLSFLQSSQSILNLENQKEILISLTVNEFQTNIQLPVKEDTTIDYQINPYIRQRISLDVDLNTFSISMNQYNQYSITKINLLKSFKISNGILLINSPLVFDNMESIHFRDLTIIFTVPISIKFTIVNEIKFQNCTVKQNTENTSFVMFQFEQVQSFFISNMNISNQQYMNSQLFNFQKCQNTSMQNINFSKIEQIQQIPLIFFRTQTGDITIQSVSIIDSNIVQFLQFQNCKKVLINSLKVSELKVQKNNNRNLSPFRTVQSYNEYLLNQNPIDSSSTFIIAQYIQESFTLDGLDITRQCSFYQFLFYQNWIEEIQNINNKLQKVKRQSQNSKIILNNINVFNTTFYQSFMDIEEANVSIHKMKMNQNLESTLKFSNALKVINISSFEASDIHVSLNNSLISIINSKILLKSLYIFNSIQKSQLEQQQEQEDRSLIELIKSDFLIDDLQGVNNTITTHFLTINKGFVENSSQDNMILFTQSDNILQNSKISKNNGDGAIKIINLETFTMKKTSLLQNNGSKNGGGVHAINTKQIQFISVEIVFNSAYQYGGGVYLEDSDLILFDSKIYRNSAVIGGGIRYNNDKIYPQFLDDPNSQIYDNQALIFGANYGSFPSKIKFIHEKPEKIIREEVHKIVGVRSATQQLTVIEFQLFGEDDELVQLPSLSSLENELKSDLMMYYQFLLNTDNEDIQIQQQTIPSQYNLEGFETTKNYFSLEKHIITTGYSKLKANEQESQNAFLFSVSSISNFKIPSREQKSIITMPLGQSFLLEFRDCQLGEIIRYVSKDFYECWECTDQTFSLVNPYSNNLLNSCENCVNFAASCQGNQIIPQEGYWIQQNTTNIFYCSNSPDSCTQKKGSKEGCSEGYYGPLCESCDYYNHVWKEKTYAKTEKYKCSICSEKEVIQTLVYVLVALFFLLYLYYQIMSVFNNKILKLKINILRQCEVLKISNSINDSQKSEFALKILICYFQIISVIFQFQLQIPSGFKAIQFFGSNIEITLYSLDCFFNSLGIRNTVHIIYLRLLWTLFQPILYCIILIAIFLVFYFFLDEKKKQKNTSRYKNLLVSAVLQVYFMLYPSLIQQSVGSFSCKKINDTSHVLSDLQFLCYDQQYYIINFCFCVPLILICIIIPILIMRELRQKQQFLSINTKLSLQYGYFFSEYKFEFSYWEIIKIYQKITIFILSGVLNENAVISSIFVTLIIIIYLNFLMRLHPYTNDTFNTLEYTSMISAVVTIMGISIISNTNRLDIIYITGISIFLMNAFFFCKFISCFTSHFIRKPKYKTILQVLIKIQQYLSFIIPEIQNRKVNISRVTKNWKTLQKHIFIKSLTQINTYSIQTRIINFISQSSQRKNGNRIKSSIFSSTQATETERRLLTLVQLAEVESKQNLDFNTEESVQPNPILKSNTESQPGKNLKKLYE